MSITGFSDTKNTNLDKAHSALSHTLLRSIARESIRAEPSDWIAFCNNILELNQRLEEARDESEIYFITGAAEKAIQGYGQKVTKFYRNQSNELQMLAANATRTVVEIHKSGSEGVRNLKSLEEKLLRASHSKSLQDCRAHIGQCLMETREEMKRQSEQTRQTVSRLHSQLNQLSDKEATPKRIGDDPVSGLAARHHAEESLEQTSKLKNKNSFAVVFVVRRVELINKKYGYAAGDQIIRAFLRHLMQGLPMVDDLFRWSGPAFLAITHRPDGLQAFRSDVMKLLAHRLEENIAVGDREVLMQVAASAITIQISQEPDMNKLFQKLDGFTKSNE